MVFELDVVLTDDGFLRNNGFLRVVGFWSIGDFLSIVCSRLHSSQEHRSGRSVIAPFGICFLAHLLGFSVGCFGGDRHSSTSSSQHGSLGRLVICLQVVVWFAVVRLFVVWLVIRFVVMVVSFVFIVSLEHRLGFFAEWVVCDWLACNSSSLHGLSNRLVVVRLEVKVDGLVVNFINFVVEFVVLVVKFVILVIVAVVWFEQRLGFSVGRVCGDCFSCKRWSGSRLRVVVVFVEL